MFGLKSAYFYFVAVQVTFVKFFKKLYFTSNHYNNSLKSKIPSQVYFNPNPFLLSIISPFKKKLFKVEEIDPNNFWLKEEENAQLNERHNFCLLYTSPSPRDSCASRMPSSA